MLIYFYVNISVKANSLIICLTFNWIQSRDAIFINLTKKWACKLRYKYSISLRNVKYHYPYAGNQCQRIQSLMFNTLWHSESIRRHRSAPTLVQIMACCLMTPSYYPNRCFLSCADNRQASSWSLVADGWVRMCRIRETGYQAQPTGP